MNGKIIFSFLIVAFSLILFTECKKKENILGPQYVAAPANFSVLGDPAHGGAQMIAYNILKSTNFPINTVPMFHGNPIGLGGPMRVNIGSNYQWYKANFSDKVSWTLTITSWKTHAVKVFQGLSNYIDSTNTRWDGGSTNDYFFGYNTTNDSAEVKLTFIGSEIVIKDTVKLSGTKSYFNRTYNGIYHYLIDDFDGGNGTLPQIAFSPFYPDLADVNGGNEGNQGYTIIKNQGNFSYRMSGFDVNGNTYIGSCNTPTLNDIPPNTFRVTDPDDMFINLYIYGTGKPNSNVSVIVFENDAGQAQGTTFNQNINDKYIYYIPITWTGWKLVSFRYSGFIKPNTGAGLGNNRLNPERLVGMALELDSYPVQGYNVEAIIDMVVVTENGPFQK